MTTKIKEDALEQQKLYETSLVKGELQEYRLFGSPGCGKTTNMSNQVVSAVKKFGSDSVLISSFTKTAAAELVGRQLPIPKEHIATLHAHAYRAIGRPTLVNMKDFNTHISNKNADWIVSTVGRDSSIDEPESGTTGKTKGDALMSKYDLLRARMQPIDSAYDEDVREFTRQYEAFKADTGTIDFTDMISIALESVELPDKYEVGFFDEVQDFTPLELSLVRKWGKGMQFVVLAGDDDQTLFAFKGATPNAFLEPELSDNYIRVLPQSYRVPRAVHSEAMALITKLSKRQYKQYMPRFEVVGYDEKTRRRIYDDKRVAEGEVKRRKANFQDEFGCEDIVGEALEFEKQGKTTMILTACNYQTDLMKNTLRKNGALFHNPYRVINGGWNPLQKDGTLKRVFAYMAAYTYEQQTWSVGQLIAWSDMVKVSQVFRRGAVANLKRRDENEEVSFNELFDIFNNDDARQAAINADLKFLVINAKESYQNRIQYIIKVIERYGVDYMCENRPRIVLGTIHSVKGGEADVVYLSPDLSWQGYQEYVANRDNAIRQYYVGMTRAFEQLHICSPNGNMHIRL